MTRPDTGPSASPPWLIRDESPHLDTPWLVKATNIYTGKSIFWDGKWCKITRVVRNFPDADQYLIHVELDGLRTVSVPSTGFVHLKES
jgi:hypothetical protein